MATADELPQATDLALASATELVRLFRERRASPVEALRAVLGRIAARNPELNAFCLVDEESALLQARASETRWMRAEPAGRVDGVPTTIKDMFLTRGWPTRRGSRTIPADGDWTEDSPLVARLREHGAVFVGKTTQPEFGWKGVTDSPLQGTTRNPWDPARTPGGSSGGAAVAAACGMGALHAGGDGAGSIRIPAAFCGIYGLKPSFGRVPNYPAKMPGSITHAGPMTRTVGDAALMLSVMAEADCRDWQELPPDHRDYTAGLETGIAGLRVAFCPNPGPGMVEPEVAALVAEAARQFEAMGAHVDEVTLDFGKIRSAFQLYYFIRFRRLCRMQSAEQLAALDPGIPAMAEAAERYTALDLLDADAAREEFALEMRLFHRRFDLLLTPQMPLVAFEAGLEYPPGRGFTQWMDWSPFTYPLNFTQQPAASVPCGLTSAGLPAALQVVADRYRDDLVLRASRAYEAAAPFRLPAGLG